MIFRQADRTAAEWIGNGPAVPCIRKLQHAAFDQAYVRSTPSCIGAVQGIRPLQNSRQFTLLRFIIFDVVHVIRQLAVFGVKFLFTDNAFVDVIIRIQGYSLIKIDILGENIRFLYFFQFQIVKYYSPSCIR